MCEKSKVTITQLTSSLEVTQDDKSFIISSIQCFSTHLSKSQNMQI